MTVTLKESPGDLDPQDRNGVDAGSAPAASAPSPAVDRAADATPARTSARQIRVITANVQSFPEDAITLDQAAEDLRRNAADGDLVLLQEIAPRYVPLVAQAFPAPEWEVFFGKSDNRAPIAFRTSLFSMVAGEVSLLHRARAHLHSRKYTTYLRLTFKPLGTDLHTTNLHLVSGAFNNKPLPTKDVRVQEWEAGIAKHLAFVEELVRTGLPVVGGGDYNRQLKRHKSLGTEVAGRPVTYAVGKSSIDLIWCIDGDHVGWRTRSMSLFPGRGHAGAQRNSDHGARLAVLDLRPGKTAAPRTRRIPAPAPAPVPVPAPPPVPAPTVDHPPFEKTVFGDGNPKTVDWKTRAALEEVERRLGYPLTVVQGSYNAGGVAVSAGTHDGGGVVDLLAWDAKNKVRVLRAVGFAAWYRPAVRGLWGEHIHAVLVDHGRLSSSAANQVVAYRAGRDGLKSNRIDPVRRPDPIPVFTYPPKPAPGGPTGPVGSRPRVAPTSGPTTGPPAGPTGTGPAHPPTRTMDGVDTSHFQGGRIDVRRAQAAGVRFWYCKATEGTTLVDATYRQRVRQARKAGIPVGAYHFARPDAGDAVQEARFFLEHSDLRVGDMLPMLDLESLEGRSAAEVSRWTGVWVATVTRELARNGMVAKPIIYTPFDLTDGFGCLLWVARYSDDFRAPRIPKPWVRAAIWQHSNGRFGPIKDVPGFGPVDVNAVHPDVPLSALRITALTPSAPPVPPRRGPATTTTTGTAAPAGLSTVHDELRAAVQNIQAALDALPER